jgi:mono/diheme cytochrome c family protein
MYTPPVPQLLRLPSGLILGALLPLLAGCSSSSTAAPAGASSDAAATSGPWDWGVPVPAHSQRAGDAAAGRERLLTEPYVGCGVPASVFPLAFPLTPENTLPGRTGKSANVPYSWNAYTAKDGVELVAQNCFGCHGGHINGELVLGLGDSAADFTLDQAATVKAGVALVKDPKEQADFQKFADRVGALGENLITKTRGTNPARNITAVLIAHRDKATLAWSDQTWTGVPGTVAPLDVPPWWRMKKKNAMFYDASGRGDQTRHMMLASSLCTDSVAEASAIYDYFADVRAFIASVEPPKYPFPVDSALAARGRTVFESTCSGCHGTYGDKPTYPNLLIPLKIIGTDSSILAVGYDKGPLVDWLNGSVYGTDAPYVPGDGYVPPPLDGIWATAPFLHNGSVPTVQALLDSKSRPQFWSRTFDSRDYDQHALGWNHESLGAGQAAESDPKKRAVIYDTTLAGYSNQGHTFGDDLTDTERTSVIEYLKTL